MIFVKVKWLPWIFIIAGIYGLFSGEWNPLLAIVVIALGGVGAYYFYGGKSTNSSAGTGSATSITPPAPKKPVNDTQNLPPVNASGTKLCPGCGAPVEDDMFFCSKCGTKVR